MEKPFSEACERNKFPILEFLKKNLGTNQLKVLEIGSGTGQHAAFFANSLANLTWQPTEIKNHFEHLNDLVKDKDQKNLLPPLEFDVNQSESTFDEKFDVIFTANTLHIISWSEVEKLFDWCQKLINPKGKVILYGPFKVNGDFTSKSNHQFDSNLKNMNPSMGIRDFEKVMKLSSKIGLNLVQKWAMPANNLILTCQKI